MAGIAELVYVILILVLIILAVISHLRRRPKRYRGGQSYRTRHRNRSYHGRRR